MAARQITVEYEDGAQDVFKLRPKHMVVYEKMFGAFEEKATDVYRLAWIASGAMDTKFDDWLERLDDVTLVPVPGEESTDGERPTDEPSLTSLSA